ncbi:aspartic-type endopeptidase protein [Rutstroemia sp. NJR-2017a WRK4]|nr:aspartic-type endopeptidase protein [Rutstroemia sp. NJR-2017a WRK4]
MKCSAYLSSPTSNSPQVTYLLGLRGFLVLQTFIWTFLQVFVPATVKSNIVTFPSDTPTYQTLIRKILSPIFWNESLLYASFVFLTGRTLCISFINSPSKETLTSSIFRRSFRLVIPTAISLSLFTLISHVTSTNELTTRFITQTSNPVIETPYKLPSPIPLTLFNSIFTLFLSTTNTPLHTLSASLSFPSSTLPILPILFSQSSTLYITSLLIPYTRLLWRLKYAPLFIFTAYWVTSFSSLSILGLLLTDLLTNPPFLSFSALGFPLSKHGSKKRLPSWIPYLAILLLGLGLQYFYTATNNAAEISNAELKAHADIYGASGGLNHNPDLREPQPRIADVLVLVGGFLLLETRAGAQNCFKNDMFVELGRRSLSYFLTQSIFIYSLGIPLYLHLVVKNDFSAALATFACFVVSVLGTLVSGWWKFLLCGWDGGAGGGCQDARFYDAM